MIRSLQHMRGAAAVELAILLLPLVVLTAGMAELGRAVYTYNTLLKSTRNAARYLSMMPRGEGEAVAACLALHGKADCTGADDPLVPGLEPGLLEITYTPAASTGSGSVDLVHVTVRDYPLRTWLPLPVGDFVFGPISTTMRQATS